LTGAGEADEGLSKTALKNKKKREARKTKDAVEKNGDAATTPFTDSGLKPSSSDVRGRESQDGRARNTRSRSRSDLQRRDPNKNWERKGPDARTASTSGNSKGPLSNGRSNAKPSAPSAVAAAPPAPEPSVTSPVGGTPNEKKVRGLLKKIRAIDDLKMRLAGGEKLEDTQMKKIYTEDSVRKELDALGYDG
jgi:translation initiation factor 2A